MFRYSYSSWSVRGWYSSWISEDTLQPLQLLLHLLLLVLQELLVNELLLQVGVARWLRLDHLLQFLLFVPGRCQLVHAAEDDLPLVRVHMLGVPLDLVQLGAQSIPLALEFARARGQLFEDALLVEDLAAKGVFVLLLDDSPEVVPLECAVDRVVRAKEAVVERLFGLFVNSLGSILHGRRWEVVDPGENVLHARSGLRAHGEPVLDAGFVEDDGSLKNPSLVRDPIAHMLDEAALDVAFSGSDDYPPVWVVFAPMVLETKNHMHGCLRMRGVIYKIKSNLW